MNFESNMSTTDFRIRATHRESLITDQLASRASRRPNYQAESKVLRRLARALATSDSAMLDMLALEAARLCRAGSAGISVLESPPDRPASFRWAALAGHCVPLLNTYRPFDDSVCGVTLALGTPELFKRPQQYFSSIEALSPPVVEALLVPVPVGDGPWGAIWVMSHDDNLRFDAEDLRLLTSLADFTGAAMQISRVQALAEKRANEAEHAQEALRRAEELTNEFIATLSHELRSPIAPIISSLEVLGRSDPGASAATRALDIAQRQMGRLQRLVDDLLDASRIRHGKVEVKMSACNLADIVWDAVNAVQPSMDARKHQLTVQCPAEPLALRADAARLTQVLVNLLSNSARYSPDGSHIQLTAVVEPAHGDSRISSPRAVRLTVSDDGYGIPKDKLPHVFGMFNQLASHKTSADSGLGIGLALVKFLVESHGGTVSISSGDGQKGTTVTVLLPVLQQHLRLLEPLNDSRRSADGSGE
ncbi:MAG TPA: GAF domain-containing sensor histidine kinase [Paraburkholderia sp.]|uniref:sensor histidine kinase n=1 Tax=Paraburkholderia sp. TaxID=1926495 RepID=UPI002B461581|nr:GAF domain-containing sensor histidine kinase [Paraburkholderia sp.]HKR39080.1 GAF domain-containing sensor histidine kinase [Paraburkholderia sp.]